MDEVLVVNFAALHAASGNIDTAVKSLHEQLGQLERDANPLVSTWDGEAKAAYDVRQQQWRLAASELAATLAEIKKALDDSALDYRSTEHRNRALFE